MTENEVRSIIEAYREAFEALDLAGIADHLSFPALIAGDGGEGVSTMVLGSREEAEAQLRRLVDSYRRLGVARVEASAVEVRAVSAGLFTARVEWRLASARGPLYSFAALYTVGITASGPRIVAIAHDELPRLRAALRG